MLMEYGLLEDVGGGYDLDHWQSAGVAAGVGKETVLETEDCHLLPYILPICPTIFSIILVRFMNLKSSNIMPSNIIVSLPLSTVIPLRCT